MDEQLASSLKLIKDLLKNSELTEAIDTLMLVDEKFGLNMGDELIVQSGRHFENESVRDQISIDDYRRFKTQVFVSLTKMVKQVEKMTKPVAAGKAPESHNQGFKPGTGAANPQTTTTQTVVNQPVTGVPKLVVLYAIEDAAFALEIEKQLKPMTRQNTIAIYFMHKVSAGADVVGMAKTAISECKKVAVLVTKDFFFYDENVELVEVAKQHGKGIVPVLVKSLSLEKTGLSGIRGLPSNNKFIYNDWPSPDSAWNDVATGLFATLVQRD